MDLKGKFKTFLADSRQKLLSPQEEMAGLGGSGGLGCLVDRTQWSDSDREVSQLASDPAQETAVLERLCPQFYTDDWDPGLHALQQLGSPGLADLNTINAARKELLTQLTTVSRRVFSLILARQADCTAQLDSVLGAKEMLGESLATCRLARAGLGRAERRFVNSSLGLLASVRRRQHAALLLHNLNTIRTLSRSGERAEELAREEDWPAAISLLLESLKVAAAYKHFTAIGQLAARLTDTLEMTEEQLDSALSKQAKRHTLVQYGRLQEAYSLLGKSRTAADQLLMHFTSATAASCWQVVHGHVCLMKELSRPAPPYPELCCELQPESFLPCLTDLVRALWGIMLSYHGVLAWHCARSDTDPYILAKLEAGLDRIWQDVQCKVKQLVLGSDLSQFSIESFLQFLDLLHRLITVGQEFISSGGGRRLGRPDSSSALLQDSLVQQCLAYFSAYHASRLEELATHLENESWTLCPVKQTFSYHLLAEFSHLTSLKSPTKATSGGESVFKQFAEHGSPFDSLCQEKDVVNEDILQEAGGRSPAMDDSDSEDDLSEEQKQQLADENREGVHCSGLNSLASSTAVPRPAPAIPRTGITVSNSAVTVLRLVGRYSHMMRVLTPIAGEVWLGVEQLFQYYLYTVNSFFTRDSLQVQSVYSEGLRQALEVIANTVVHQQLQDGDSVRLVGCVRAAVPLLGAEPGLAARLVGVESAVFLACQLVALRPHFTSLLPASDPTLDLFYSKTAPAAAQLRSPIYLAAVAECLDTEATTAEMGRVCWDLRDVVSQHSRYVDQLVLQLQMFADQLTKLALQVPLPRELCLHLWEQLALLTSVLFVDGFASAKKCTNEGRALMQLDYRQFVLKLETLSGLKPMPHQQFVTAYIKAYYIPESELGQWVEQHPEYTAPQLRALVAYNNNSNKTKQKLNSLINDLSDRIRR